MPPLPELQAADLVRRCDPTQFDFASTAELADLTVFVGQPRAREAIDFGIGIKKTGYNLYALGPAGSGKRTLVRRLFEEQAAHDPVPSDWCYVNNFVQPHSPHALELPPGRGAALQQTMKRLVEAVAGALPVAFESEEYQTRAQVILEEFKERQAHAFEAMQKRAEEHQIALMRTPAGLAFAPVRNGEVMSIEEVQKLGEEDRATIQKQIEDLQEEMARLVRQFPGWQREMQEKMTRLNREMAGFAVGGLISDVREKFADVPGVVAYLDAVQNDVIENARDFLPPPASGSDGEAAQRAPEERPSLRRYHVNLLVDHSQSTVAPVVAEDNPTFQNLVGRVEYVQHMGALVTDFSLIKPGCLHSANGGYLILDAREVLLQPYAWEGLKRTLKAGQIRIESLGQLLSLISTVSLEPEPIPLTVKIALVGDRMLYYLLYNLDPDFGELFKVAVDFAEDMDRTPENQRLYALLLGTLARREGLRPLDRGAVARVIEYSARVIGDAGKLSTWMRGISDLVQEADYWADRAGNGAMTADDVQRAIDAATYRNDRMRERLQEEVVRGTVLIDTAGTQVGQINGLSVLALGNFSFGRPSRITAQVRLGRGDVVDIEREVQLGGPIHSKGVLILSSYLGARYAADTPLSLSASLVFEQSYGGIEGDSASSAELYALLSAIAQVPIKQSLAVTGSVNQHGQVQAIGGVNEKIEGFFDLCQARGLTGAQGVLIPASNVKHLMLRQDVVDAVAAGQFHIYPVETIDQGIELLTGMPAGEPDDEGHFPAGSLNARVFARLAELASKRSSFGSMGQEHAQEPKP
jgi:lon-related putative ATP-dependent protease